MTSPSIRPTSVMWVMRRRPSTSRFTWMIRSNALAIWSRMALSGRSKPAVRTRVSVRARASRGLFAWIVVSEPSWPVFIAWSMSTASPPRHSPTTIRSGRMRSAFRTRSRIVIAPLPSMLDGRASRLMTCFCASLSSAASSIVMMRSRSGMNDESTFRSVVLPVPVPPEIRTFSLPSTHASRKAAAWCERLPKATRSSMVSGSRENLRIVSDGPVIASGGMIAFTREPSGRRASTIGLDSSIRRPVWATIRSITWSRWRSEPNRTSVSSMSPRRST